MSEQTAARGGTDRLLWVIVAGAVGLVLVGLAVVLLVDRQPAPVPADPASPAGVVQAYLDALNEGDAEEAYNYLSRSAKAVRPFDEYRREFPLRGQPFDREQRVVIEPIEQGPQRAEVRVTISNFSVGGGPFSTNTYHRDVTVRLVRENGAWRIDQPAEPYSLLY